MPRHTARATDQGTDITIHVDNDTLAQLDDLSRKTGRSREQIVSQAVRDCVVRAHDPSLGTDKAVPPPKGG